MSKPVAYLTSRLSVTVMLEVGTVAFSFLQETKAKEINTQLRKINLFIDAKNRINLLNDLTFFNSSSYRIMSLHLQLVIGYAFAKAY